MYAGEGFAKGREEEMERKDLERGKKRTTNGVQL